MLFLSTIVALLPLAALASPLPPVNNKAVADYATISKVLNDVIAQCNDLVAKTKSFSGEAIDAVPILDSSGALLAMLKEGVTKISTTETIGLMDSIQVLYPVYNLNTAVDLVVKSLIEKKAMFDKAGVTFVVQDRLSEEKAAAQDLVTAVVGRLPAYLPGVIGTTAAAPILKHLDEAVAAFSKPAR